MVCCNNLYGFDILVGKKMAINEKQKWPTDKRKYDKNYLRLYGEKCPVCGGTGGGAAAGWMHCCPKCKGLGYVEKKK